MMTCGFDCKICHGAGFIDHGDLGVELCPNDPAKYFDAGVELNDKRIPALLPRNAVRTNIGNALLSLRKAGSGMLYIQGPFGIGKTVLARAATVEAVDMFGSALYRRHSELANYLRASFSNDYGQAELVRRIDRFSNVLWLVIDEIGRVNDTDFVRESVGEIVDARYRNALRGRAMTVLISNDPPESVFDAYLVDRIRDVKNKVLVLNGESLRKAVRK